MKCTYCSNDSLMFCRSHGKHICAELECISLHRYGVGGNPVCHLYQPDPLRDWISQLGHADRIDWLDVAVAATALVAVTLFISMIAVHGGR